MERITIYLTGGIATGKSTVAQIFRELGAEVIDADKIAHDVIKKGKSAYFKVLELFGKDILDSYGEIDRKKLGNIVFANRELLRKLEEIIHPEVIREMMARVSEVRSDVLVIEIPLIFEKGMNLKPVVLVYAPRHLQKERLMKRDGISEEEAEQRLSAQMDIEEKKKLADYIIDNSGSIDETREQVKSLLLKLKNEFRKQLS